MRPFEWSPYEVARDLIDKGYRVFPVLGDATDDSSKRKAPATARGHHDAIDAKSDVSWRFKEEHWVGVVAPKDVFFLDVDDLRDIADSREDAAKRFLSLWDEPPHIIQRSPRGGIHLGPFYRPEVKQGVDIFKHSPDPKLQAIKVDVRMGMKGYIATGPSYDLVDGFPPTHRAVRLPDRFVPSSTPGPDRAEPTVAENLPEDTHALLEHLCRHLNEAPAGERNQPLFNAAVKMGHHIGAGLIDEDIAQRRLLAASIQGGHDINDAQKTTLSGLHIGMEHDGAIERLRGVTLPSTDHDAVARQITIDCEVDGKPGLLSLDDGESYYRFDPDQGWTCLTKNEMDQLILKRCRRYRAPSPKGTTKIPNTQRFRAEVLDFLR